MSSIKLQKKVTKDEKVRIKAERNELFPLSHYVDDRVELTKQIFSSLKGKTIRNLAPKFLKESSIEEIEELCLNELLGLSKKRLLAIINATKCPTDTESSSDSDVHNIEEHISLEEISSESETEKNGASRPKKAKKNRTSTQKQKDGANDKSVSVLELLELQARARAIRSQLALEPVAKIEVDSDDSSDEKLTTVEARNSSPRKDECIKGTEVYGSGLNVTTNGAKSTQQKGRIKLKRNFRKRSEIDMVNSRIEEVDKEESRNNCKALDGTVQKDSNSKTDEAARSASPDVITILPSPELLCISDSSDEDDRLKNISLQSNFPNIVLNELSHNAGSTLEANESSKQQADKNLKANESHPSEGEINEAPKNSLDEIEDGEIVDSKETAEETAEISNCNVTKKAETTDSFDEADKAERETTGKDGSKEDIAPNMMEKDASMCDDNKPSPEERAVKSEMLTSAEQFEHASITEMQHQNDDVISLGNEDLDDDLHESKKPDSIIADKSSPELKGEVSKCSDHISIEQLDSDIITLDNSSDEESTLGRFADGEDQSQSWNCRWLKSDRVTKILAASRLGNRVREKVKQSKKTCEPTSAVVHDLQTEVFQSQFEDGSVQQYAEILDRKL